MPLSAICRAGEAVRQEGMRVRGRGGGTASSAAPAEKGGGVIPLFLHPALSCEERFFSARGPLALPCRRGRPSQGRCGALRGSLGAGRKSVRSELYRSLFPSSSAGDTAAECPRIKRKARRAGAVHRTEFRLRRAFTPLGQRRGSVASRPALGKVIPPGSGKRG